MRIITTASYNGTGSSAVTDFFSEFENCKSLGDYEFRFAQDPDGLSDLEYNIVENNHRLNTSQAIKRYYKLVKRLDGTWYASEYRNYFGDAWLELSKKYINDITQRECVVWWHQDQIDHGELFRFCDRLINKIYRTLHGHRGSYGKCISLLSGKEHGYFTYLKEHDFLRITRSYTDALFASANNDSFSFFIVDQLVPPSNIKRYSRYFKDLVTVVVERDPRDIYIREKIAGWGVMPANTVKEFCDWFRITREHRKHEVFDDNVILLQFEDLIYKYEETTKILMDFVGMDEKTHTKKFEFFDPKISIKNTNLKVQYPEFNRDIQFIEQYLTEYLYDFDIVK